MEHLTQFHALMLALPLLACVLTVRLVLHVLVRHRILSGRIEVGVLALVSLGCTLLMCSVVSAQDAAPAPPVETLTPIGVPLIEKIFVYLGMVVTFLSALAAILPKSWKLTQVIARFSADLRGILTPDPADDPEWARKLRGRSSLMIILGALCVVPGCALFRDTVQPVAVECAPERHYVIEGLTEILAGADAFDVLNRIKDEKGPELVLCALERFLDRAGVSPETEVQRRRARAYLDHR